MHYLFVEYYIRYKYLLNSSVLSFFLWYEFLLIINKYFFYHNTVMILVMRFALKLISKEQVMAWNQLEETTCFFMGKKK